MSNSLNKVILIGRLGEDVKLTYFDNGNCIGRFSLATEESYTNREGQKTTSVDWHTIVVRNKMAEVCEKYLAKGDLIYIEGKLKNRQWQADNGVTHNVTEVYATEFKFLNTRSQTQKNTNQAQDNSEQNEK